MQYDNDYVEMSQAGIGFIGLMSSWCLLICLIISKSSQDPSSNIIKMHRNKTKNIFSISGTFWRTKKNVVGTKFGPCTLRWVSQL